MRAFLDCVIRHGFYKEVNSTYILAQKRYSTALNLCLQEQAETMGNGYEFKKYVHSNIHEIERLSNCIRIAQSAIRNSKKSVEWFFHDRGRDGITSLGSKDYELIADHINLIRQYASNIREYNNLIINQKEAVDRLLGVSLNCHTFDQIKLIVSSKRELSRIDKVLKDAHSCENEYPQAWKVFSRGLAFGNIALDELESIDYDYFFIKEQFINLYKAKKRLCDVIMGEKKHDLACFSEEVIEKEHLCLISEMEQSLYVHPYAGEARIDGIELKRAILDSIKYGKEVNFVDSFSIFQFYKLRQEADNLGLGFDTIIARTIKNRDAIKSFNNKKIGKSVVFIEDYIPASTEGTPLYNYIETYREQKEKRYFAKQIAANYPLGFACLFDSNVDLDSCELSVIVRIIDSKQRIITKESEEVEKERRRKEEERKRKEEEEKREKICRMKACVSGWHITRYGFYHAYLYEYLKTTAPREADEYEWNIRHLIWAFKNDPNKQDRQYSYRAALNEIVPKYEKKLRDTFGSLLSDMTLVCLPASSSEKNSRRWQEFSRKVCSDLSMWNAYDYIHIEQEAVPKHLGGDGKAVLSFNQSFFNGKYVILCDDIKTTGSSLQRMKHKLESMGATVICSLTIGITVHE